MRGGGYFSRKESPVRCDHTCKDCCCSPSLLVVEIFERRSSSEFRTPGGGSSSLNLERQSIVLHIQNRQGVTAGQRHHSLQPRPSVPSVPAITSANTATVVVAV